MFSNGGWPELLLFPIIALIMALVPIALGIWVIMTLSRIRHGIERIAAAAERMADARSLP